MNWDPPTTAEAAHALGAVERFRRRLHELARAAGVPAPPLTLDEDERPRRRWPAGPRRTGRPLIVTLEQLGADAAIQDWTIASALGQRTSSTVRRRRRLGAWLLRTSFVLHVSLGALNLFDVLDDWPYRWVVGIAWAVVGGILTFTAVAAFRSSLRARDEVAFGILAAAGRDPAAVTRHVFRDTTRFSWWKRVERFEPTDQDRIAAAERHGIRPVLPLH